MPKPAIDLSDRSQYPANVLANLNFSFSLGDDDDNMLRFLQDRWAQPKFHWGWDDYTHEEAEKSGFLQRAFCNMNMQHKQRRDAMIESEGCVFVWGDPDSDPVPGYLTGEQLCRYMNHSLKVNLNDIKSIKAQEERQARGWHLDPTYDELMAEISKADSDRYYHHSDLGCGMHWFANRANGNRQSFLLNTALKKMYPILDASGKVLAFNKGDIDWESVRALENHGNAERLVANYYFGIGAYHDGVAQVTWMLYPDGRYFADSDGFGMQDNDETCISAYIDTECRVLVKFRDKESDGNSAN